MKKSIIALSVAAAMGGLAGTATAQPMSPYFPADHLEENFAGVGHILYVPYFSTQSGNVTAISIVNTDTYNGKVLKVRFRGASNSDDVYDFQVFMSPGDVWTAGIARDADGRSRLDTADKSCTLPANVNGKFITSRTTGPAAADRPEETREGYIEILNMADIPGIPESYRSDPYLENYWALWDAVKHVNGVAPCTPAVLNALTRETVTGGAALWPGLSYPTTGLMANWTIINVDKVIAYSGGALALEARATGNQPAQGNLVYWDQRATPLTQQQAESNTADPLLRGAVPVVQGARYDLPDMSTPYLPVGPSGITAPFAQAKVLSDAIAVDEVAFEFFNTASIGASTDWVITFPTRRYWAAVKYGSTPAPVYNKGSDGNVYFTSSNTEMGSVNGAGKAYQLCSRLGVSAIAFFDREETPQVSDDIVISPGTPTQLSLCGEVTVVSVNGSTQAGSATFANVARANLSNSFKEGWGYLSVPATTGNAYTGDTSGTYYFGLPMVARQFSRVNNTTTQQYYGLSFPGRVTYWGYYFPDVNVP